jgi:hypothetical protein
MVNELLKSMVKDLVFQALKTAAIGQAHNILLSSVAERYTQEVRHNMSNYINSVALSNIEIDSEGSGEKLFYKFQRSLKTLETEIEKQGENSPILRYLKEKYGSKSPAIMVGLKPQPIYSLYTEKSPDLNRPWTDRSSKQKDIGEYIASEASRIMDGLMSSQNT